jgi:protein LTV1
MIHFPPKFFSHSYLQTGDVIFGKSDEQSNVTFAKARDHITELGFVNDGYDYSKHLKTMGGGTFIGKDGAVSRALSLPSDILPSEEELRRDYEAITITHGRGSC